MALRGALLAEGAERVEVFAGDAVLGGDHVGADALRRQAGLGVAVELLLREREAHVPRTTDAPIGVRVMTSTPAATTMSYAPAMTPCAPKCIACWLEPHWRSTVVDGTDFGPAGGEHGVATDVERLLADLHHAAHDDVVDDGRGRGGCAPASALSTWAASAAGCQSLSLPLRLPPGVRTASTITASVMVSPHVVFVFGEMRRRFPCRRVITSASVCRSSRAMPVRSSARSTWSMAATCCAMSRPSAERRHATRAGRRRRAVARRGRACCSRSMVAPMAARPRWRWSAILVWLTGPNCCT